MSNPGQGGNQPHQGDNPYAGPGAYRGPSDPGRYGSSPAYGQQEPYVYNPYSNAPPAGTGGDDVSRPAPRPGVMIVSLVLLVVSALPFLAFGVVFLALPIDAQQIVSMLPTIDPSGQLAAAGITPEQLLGIIRAAGGIVAALAAVYILFAVLAFTGRNWARVAVTVLTVGFGLLLLAGVFQGAAAGSGSGFSIAVLVASVAGVVLMFLPASQQYFASRRR